MDKRVQKGGGEPTGNAAIRSKMFSAMYIPLSRCHPIDVAPGRRLSAEKDVIFRSLREVR